MERKLNFTFGIIPGYQVRDVVDVFPELEDYFKQRKLFDEYYYEGYNTKVQLTIEKISMLSDLEFSIRITWDEIILD